MRIAVIAFLSLACTAQAAAQTNPPRRQLVEELRLDANTEDFPAVGWFTVGPHGQIVVPIDPDQQLRFYDAQGKKVGALGRKGSGPGEFRRMGRYGWLHDTLWVYDFDQQRITYISPDTKLIRSDVIAPKLNEGMSGKRDAPPEAGTVYSFVPWAVAPDGALIGPAMIAVGLNATKTMDTKSLVIATSATGDKRRTVVVPPTTSSSVTFRPGDGSAFGSSVPFVYSPWPEYASDGTRVGILTTDVTATTGSYSVVVIRSQGDTVFSRRYSAVPAPIPASVMDSAINRIGAPRSNGRVAYPPGVAEKLREMARAKAPTAYPPVSGLVLGVDGTTWVLLRKQVDGTTAVALDSKGNPVASILVPLKSRLVQATMKQVWMLETDDDGLSSIVRYRLK